MPESCTILVVEDDAPLRSFVADLLRDEGYRVLDASDGAEAIAILDREVRDSIALIVLDMSMPRVDGLAFLEHLAASGQMVPVIAMSAVRESLIAAQARGARDTLAKPFDLERFLAIVAQNCPRDWDR